MEIIVHGKPNSGSFNATSGIDKSLVNNIVQNFFQSMDKINEKEILIVDARLWKGQWYSIYTYWLGKTIKDTADRTSYFAVSVIVPGRYYCLISEVYAHLKNIYHNFAKGTYVSNGGRYIVQNFSDDELFNELVALINSDKFVNLEEEFDSGFTSATNPHANVRYSTDDCDSKAFVYALQQNGRIMVSETFKSKDSMLADTDKYIAAIKNYQTEIKLQDEDLARYKKLLDHNASQANETIKSKDQEIGRLSAEIERLKTGNGIKPEKPEGKMSNEKLPFAKLLSQWRKNIPQVNTLLLIVILLFVIPGKSCSKTDESAINELKQQINNQDLIIDSLNRELSTQYETTDIDCGIKLIQNGQTITPQEIDLNKPVIINVSTQIDGYDLHTTNLNGHIVLGTPTILVPEQTGTPIIISYRSKNVENRNQNNMITIYPI